MEHSKSTAGRFAIPMAVGVLVITLMAVSSWRSQRAESSDSLVVYCAHDAEFSEEILRAFEAETGISVSIRFDEEATKSLGLVNQILAEKDSPRCDVFWNNQLLNTLTLRDAGVLEPYKSAATARIPDRYRDAEGFWTGFAGRLRVYIVNTEKMLCSPEEIARRLDGDLRRVAIAKPLFGTTRSHYAVLWESQGPQKTQTWHRSLHQRSIREVQGNSTVRNLVADGICDLGFTDTDDFFGAVDRQKSVAMLPVRLPDGATICIPNTVCIVRGTTRRSLAEKLVDYLISEKTELALARSRSRQIPLGQVDETAIPDEVRPLREWAANGFDLKQAAASQADCLRWLKSETLP